MNLKLKKILITALVSVGAAAVICVLVVGTINGVWPWSAALLGKDYTGMRPHNPEATENTIVPEETTTVATEPSTQTTTPSGSAGGTVTDDEQTSTQPTEEIKLPIGVVTGQPSEEEESSEPTNPSDKKEITFDELIGAAKNEE